MGLLPAQPPAAADSLRSRLERDAWYVLLGLGASELADHACVTFRNVLDVAGRDAGALAVVAGPVASMVQVRQLCASSVLILCVDPVCGLCVRILCANSAYGFCVRVQILLKRSGAEGGDAREWGCRRRPEGEANVTKRGRRRGARVREVRIFPDWASVLS